MKGIIIEDEIPAAQNLKSILARLGTIEVTSILESIAETVDWFSYNPQPEIIFMDIHLADGSAFEIFNQVQIRCPVIFTTAYDEYALRAFKVNSVDYILKPVDIESVRRALDKLSNLSRTDHTQDAVNAILESLKKKTTGYRSNFLVPVKGDKLIPLPAETIACFFIDSGIIYAISFDQKRYRFDYTLDDLIEMLDPDMFFRANRQYIISRMAIKDIDLWFNNRLSVNLKFPVPEKILVSKARISEFKSWFGGS
jgi:DNA-binding LytR/AlgR family response regulator